MLTSTLPYKEAKEAFVSQLQGGSISKINSVSLVALTTYSFWACLKNRRVAFIEGSPLRNSGSGKRWTQTISSTWLLEYVLLVLPIVLALTILSDYLIILNGLLVSACAYVLYFYPATMVEQKKKEKKQHWAKSSFEDHDEDVLQRKPSRVSLHDADPLRISVDSAADSALASAAPPTQFIPPGVEDSFYSTYSSDSGHTALNGSGLKVNHSWSPASASPLYKSTSGNNSPADPSRSKLHQMNQGLHEPISDQNYSSSSSSSSYLPRNQPFLSVYRAHMMLMTIICILAVDFQAFPREFAKCETWGTSLMDMGVGSFVFSMGIVSALPLLRSPSQRFKPLRAQLLRDARRSLPLLLLGFIRIVMVKGVDYPEHVSEYGVHWNFFITLALLPFFGTLCRPLAKLARYSILGLFVTCFHQLLLTFTNLGSWTISNSIPRTSLLVQNKEGVVSFPGYLALFFLGMDLGHYLLPRDPYMAYRRPSKSRQVEKTDKLAMLLASFSILWWTSFYIVTLALKGTVSRRLANLPYVLWVTAYNSTFLLYYVFIYIFLLQPLQGNQQKSSIEDIQTQRNDELQESKTPLLFHSINHAAFVVFLVANLLTGLVNVSIQTMYTSHLFAIIILTLYTSICLAWATHIHIHNWKLSL